MPKLVALVTSIALTSCTLVGVGVTAGTVAMHNGAVDDVDEWSYSVPMAVGAIVGAIADISLLLFAAKQWSKPMT